MSRRRDRGALPPGPFVEWIHGQVRAHGGQEPCAIALGISVDNLHRLTRTTEAQAVKTVRLDMVDRVFCNVGEPWLLRELYPELYENPRVAA
jgi:hypothetical protein